MQVSCRSSSAQLLCPVQVSAKVEKQLETGNCELQEEKAPVVVRAQLSVQSAKSISVPSENG